MDKDNELKHSRLELIQDFDQLISDCDLILSAHESRRNGVINNDELERTYAEVHAALIARALKRYANAPTPTPPKE